MTPTPPTIDAPERREAAIKAVAQIEMDREGYPLSRHLDEIYTDAAETVDAVLGIFAVSAVGRREAVARLIDPNAWYHRDNGRVAWGGDIDGSLAKADAILELLAASSVERIASSDEMLCEGCGKSINRGQFVHVYDDVGEVHVDCDQPNAFSDDPMAMVMVGDPMRRIAPSAKASSGEREKALEDAAEVVVGLRSRCGVETFTDRAQRQILMIAEEKIRALATPATVEEIRV